MQNANSQLTNYKRITVLGLALLASIMSTSILTVLVPEVLARFSVTMLQWQIRNVLFFATFSGLMIFFGKITDRATPKRVLTVSMATFIVACVGSWVSVIGNSWGLFLSFQTLQAIADAAMVPAIMKVIRLNFPKEKIGWALGTFGAVLSAAAILGPMVGALFQSTANWPLVFLSLAGIALLSLLGVTKFFPEVSLPNKSNVHASLNRDLLSGILLVMGISACQFLDQDYSRFSLTVLLICILLYLLNEHMRKDGGYVPWELFKRSAFFTSAFRAFLTGILRNVGILVLPPVLRIVFNLDPSVVAIALACQGGMAILGGSISGRFADKNALLTILIGNLLVLAALLMLSGIVIPVSNATTIAFYSTFGLALAFVSTAQSRMAIMALTEEETGRGMSLYHFLNFTSGAFSAGLFASLFIDKTDAHLFEQSWSLITIGCTMLTVLGIVSLAVDLLMKHTEASRDARKLPI